MKLGNQMIANKKFPKLRFPEFNDEWEEKKLGSFLLNEVREIPLPNKPYLNIGVRSHFRGLMHRPDFDPSKVMMDKLFVVKPRDLVVNITFAWEGAVAIAGMNDDGGLVSHRFPTYRFNENLVLGEFFRYIFPRKRFKYELGLASPGGAGRNRVLSKKEFLKIIVLTPRIYEQEKIAGFLGAVDDKINLLSKNMEQLEKYRKGLMQKIFRQEIRFKDKNGQDFSAWQEKRLSSLGNTYNGLTGKSGDDFGSGEPFITYKQIFDKSIIDFKKSGRVSIKPNENQNISQYGDIFFTTSSETPEEVGFASAQVTSDKAYLNSFCFGYRPNDLNEIVPEFARYLFRSDLFRRKMYKLAQGSTRYNISKVGFMKTEINIPSTDEQRSIAEFLSSIDDKIEAEERKLEKAKEFKKALLQQMFV